LCCGNTSLRCKIVKDVAIHPPWHSSSWQGCVCAAFLGLGAVAALGGGWFLVQPELQPAAWAAVGPGLLGTTGCGREAVAWQDGAPPELRPVSSVRRMLCCCAPKEPMLE